MWIVLVALSAILGAITTLGFAPTNYFLAPFAGLIYLLYLNKKKIQHYKLASYCFGVGYFFYGISWLHISLHLFGNLNLFLSYCIVLCSALVLGLYMLLFSWLTSKITTNLGIAACWVGILYLRGVLFTGFPWLEIGYTQLTTPLGALLPVVGEFGVSFVIVYLSALVVDMLNNKQLILNFLIAGSIILSCCVVQYYYRPIKISLASSKQVLLYQPNISPAQKWNYLTINAELNSYNKFLTQVANKNLIVFPETAVNVPENYLQPLLLSWQKILLVKHAQLVTGSIYLTNPKTYFNSMIVLGDPNDKYSLQTTNRYNKYHLVPFGEYVPYKWLFAPLAKLLAIPMSGFTRGQFKQGLLQLNSSTKFLPLICYEIAFEQSLYARFTPQAKFLICISDDSWFGKSKALYQQLQIAQVVSKEYGRYLLEDSDSGITAVIGPWGNIVKQASINQTCYIKAVLHATNGNTFYALGGGSILKLWIVCIVLGDLVVRKIIPKLSSTESNSSFS